MQNKGLVLSLADVQALRNAGFTPKGTLVQGGPQGYAEGGMTNTYTPLTPEQIQEKINSGQFAYSSFGPAPVGDVLNGATPTQGNLGIMQGGGAGTGTTPYTGPMSGGLGSNNPNAQQPTTDQLGPGQELVVGPDGWYVKDTPSVTSKDTDTNDPFGFLDKAAGAVDSNTANPNAPVTGERPDPFANYQDAYAGTSTTPYSGVMSSSTKEGTFISPPSADQLGSNQKLVFSNDGWAIVENDAPPAEPQAQLTQRERLLGPGGIDAYNEAQANLMGTTQQPVSEEVTPPAAETPATPPTAEAPAEQPAAEAPAAAPAPTPPRTPEDAMRMFREESAQRYGSATAGGAATATAQTAATPERPDLAKAEAVLASDEVKAYLEQFRAAQGEVEANNLVNAALGDPNTLAQLQLEAAQISGYQQVGDVTDRTLTEGELISGPSVEQEKVEKLVSDIKAETAQPSELATVQGQLAKLTADFDSKNPPAWAAGALRNATAQMAARGLGASSIAGQAILQATLEAATPIAAADAATVAQFEQQNLSNRQQATMFAAQQRAAFLGQEFDQAFQTKVANASRIAEIANMNFNADVQIALENARLAQSTDVANLSAANAKVLADAAAMSNMDITNLNNRQQAQVANAKAFLDINMANLNNRQQANIFKAQLVSNSMLTDQAAANAAVNLNTTNENQLNQFFAQIEANVAQFNAAQSNAIAQSNVSEINALNKFNTEQANAAKIAYDRNQAAISQARIAANASIQSTQLSSAASVQAAEFSAKASLEAARLRSDADRAIQAAANETRVTLQEMEQQWQMESDIMAMAYDTMSSNADKAFELVAMELQGQIDLEAARWQMDAAEDAATDNAWANILTEGAKIIGGSILKKINPFD